MKTKKLLVSIGKFEFKYTIQEKTLKTLFNNRVRILVYGLLIIFSGVIILVSYQLSLVSNGISNSNITTLGYKITGFVVLTYILIFEKSYTKKERKNIDSIILEEQEKILSMEKKVQPNKNFKKIKSRELKTMSITQKQEILLKQKAFLRQVNDDPKMMKIFSFFMSSLIALPLIDEVLEFGTISSRKVLFIFIILSVILFLLTKKIKYKANTLLKNGIENYN